jgi:hypothetical protein
MLTHSPAIYAAQTVRFAKWVPITLNDNLVTPVKQPPTLPNVGLAEFVNFAPTLVDGELEGSVVDVRAAVIKGIVAFVANLVRKGLIKGDRSCYDRLLSVRRCVLNVVKSVIISIDVKTEHLPIVDW